MTDITFARLDAIKNNLLTNETVVQPDEVRQLALELIQAWKRITKLEYEVEQLTAFNGFFDTQK